MKVSNFECTKDNYNITQIGLLDHPNIVIQEVGSCLPSQLSAKYLT